MLPSPVHQPWRGCPPFNLGCSTIFCSWTGCGQLMSTSLSLAASIVPNFLLPISAVTFVCRENCCRHPCYPSLTPRGSYKFWKSSHTNTFLFHLISSFLVPSLSVSLSLHKAHGDPETTNRESVPAMPQQHSYKPNCVPYVPFVTLANMSACVLLPQSIFCYVGLCTSLGETIGKNSPPSPPCIFVVVWFLCGVWRGN